MKKVLGSVALLYVKGGLLAYRLLDRDGMPKSGFRLLRSSSPKFARLSSEIAENHRGTIRLVHDEGFFPLPGGSKIHGFLVLENSALAFPKRAEVRFIKEGDLSSVYLDPLDRAIVERFFALSHYYLGYLGDPRSPEEDRAAAFLLSSFRYFERLGRIDPSETKIFEDMMKHGASLPALRKAHAHLFSFYHLDINEFADLCRLKRERKAK